MDNVLANLIVDASVVPQMITPFNGVAKIYTPRYRQTRFSTWIKNQGNTKDKAIQLTYQEIKYAFQHFLTEWNNGRPFYIVGHSQGTVLAKQLIQEFFPNGNVSDNLIAAYLMGQSVGINELPIPICDSETQTGCYVSWNSITEGGDIDKELLPQNGDDRISCVNPISWDTQSQKIEKHRNSGSLPLTFVRKKHRAMNALDTHLVGARCGENGILWIDKPSKKTGYTVVVSKTGSFHAYDVNLFYSSIRENAHTRLQAFLNSQ
ncbi:MAG: DUF3089 domain-containing protein [Pseudomonadota bacterium]